MSGELTASEAAARLGVKRATLYAYVSRGLIRRHLAMDGRTSLFDSDEVESLRSRRRRRSEGELDTVITTSLTQVNDGDLRIRGVSLAELAAADIAYERVATFLWGAPPMSWSLSGEVTRALLDAQHLLPPTTSRIDRLRVSTSVLSATDPLRFDLTSGAVREAGAGILQAMVLSLPTLGSDPSDGGLADRLWPRLTALEADEQRSGTLNAALVLLIDHGLAASTFAARVAASVRADPYSVVGAGLGVLGGALHGAMSAAVHELLQEAHATQDPGGAVGAAHRRLGGNPGFGHMVYEREDPRYHSLMGRVSQTWRDDPRLGTVHAVRDLVSQRTDAIPNIDLAIGALSWLGEMDLDAGEAIFAIARTAGWLAHALEEYQEEPLRFRPRARYTGERSRSADTVDSLNG